MRPDKLWTDEAAIDEFLRTEEIGHLTTLDDEGWPHTVPLDYVWHEEAIFFHTGPGGKLDRLTRNPKTSFAVTEALDLVTSEVHGDFGPCRDLHLGRSVLIRGLAEEIADPSRKLEILNLIIAKYDPRAARLGNGQAGSGDAASPPGLTACRVVRLETVSLTARRLLMQNKPKDRRAATADYFQRRGLALGSARNLKTALLLRETLDGR